VNEIKPVGHNTHLAGNDSRQKSKLNCFENAIYSPYKIRLDIIIIIIHVFHRDASLEQNFRAARYIGNVNVITQPIMKRFQDVR